MEPCPAVHKATMLASPPPCHAEGVLADGRWHQCRMNVGHHGVHRCYCKQEFDASPP